MWGGLATCGRLPIGLRTESRMPRLFFKQRTWPLREREGMPIRTRRPIGNRPQVGNPPHTGILRDFSTVLYSGGKTGDKNRSPVPRASSQDWIGNLRPLLSEVLENDRQDAHEDDTQHHLLEVAVDPRNSTQVVAGQRYREHPTQATKHIERNEARISHTPPPRHERRERSHDGYEFRVDKGLAAVPVIEVARPGDVLLLEQARIRAREYGRARAAAQQISALIP